MYGGFLHVLNFFRTQLLILFLGRLIFCVLTKEAHGSSDKSGGETVHRLGVTYCDVQSRLPWWLFDRNKSSCHKTEMKVKGMHCKSHTLSLMCRGHCQSGCTFKRNQINKRLPFRIMLSDIDILLWAVRPRSKEWLIKFSQLDLESVNDIQSQSQCVKVSRPWLKTTKIWKTLLDEVSRR